MADHTCHAIVDQLLRNGHSGLRVGGVVLRIQGERDWLPADPEFLRIEIFDGEPDAVSLSLPM